MQSIRYKMIVQMTWFIASKLQLYIPERTLLNCRCNVFWPSIAIAIAVFLKKTAPIEKTGIRLHDADLEHSLMKEKEIYVRMFFFPFLCYGIPDLALGILKMLIRVCFRNVLQPANY